MAHFITVRVEIDAAHRLLWHKGKCHNVHGHRYTFEVTCAAVLDQRGLIADFGDVKRRLAQWLGDNWDHRLILQAGDPIIQAVRADVEVAVLGAPPTAEIMARVLFEQAVLLFADFGVTVQRVRCYETPTCWSEYDGT